MNDALIFLLLAGIALVFKWLSNRGASEEGEPGATSPNEPTPHRPPAQREEERVRRFLEALGVPPGTSPPPPVRPRRVIPRQVVNPTPRPPTRKLRRGLMQPLPPLVTTPAEQAPPPLTTAAPLPQVVLTASPPPTIPGSRVAPGEVVRQTRTGVSAATRPASLGEMLRARGSARQAIILREVLGPPRGLQSLEEFRV